MAQALALADRFKGLKELPGLKADACGVQRMTGDVGERVAIVAARDVRDKETVMVIPENLAVTRVDAESHPVVGPLAAEASELTALTLWLLAERAAGAGSNYAGLLATLPESTLSPLLWSDAELEELMAGSPVLPEARSRKKALADTWAALAPKLAADPARFPAGRRAAGARKGVVVWDGAGSEMLLNDGRPNGELLLATGTLQDNNSSDFLSWPAGLVPADRYYMMKSQVLESMGYSAAEEFPVYADRMPIQLLAYLRLSRVADPALLAKCTFEADVELSQMNEYEILQILMGDCRERLASYTKSYEEDVKIAQQSDLSPKERLAVKLRLGEKRIINATMEAVRRRLAPIRGIPTKSGQLADPNSDLKEIFDTIESIPTAPLRLMQGLVSWARGDDDPEWYGKKKPGQGRK
eukprot:XP_001696900.1 rubisco small subunit N-methyltransferase [Chlamydomonas reinhardtii]